MSKERLLAFSDGVIAVLITIMVLELKVPHGSDWAALAPLVPVFLTYVLSYIVIGIYWNNHHHMFQLCHRINGQILWANLHLLFWLSLIPFTTGWMGENHFGALPTAAYGVVLVGAALSYTLLQTAILKEEGRGDLRGVLHCFTGDTALARAGLDLGLYLSFAGIVTFPKAGALRDTARIVPLDRLLVETDSPYLAPTPYRGKRNEPAYVARVVATLAELHGVEAGDIARVTAANFHSLFRP